MLANSTKGSLSCTYRTLNVIVENMISERRKSLFFLFCPLLYAVCFWFLLNGSFYSSIWSYGQHFQPGFAYQFNFTNTDIHLYSWNRDNSRWNVATIWTDTDILILPIWAHISWYSISVNVDMPTLLSAWNSCWSYCLKYLWLRNRTKVSCWIFFTSSVTINLHWY